VMDPPSVPAGSAVTVSMAGLAANSAVYYDLAESPSGPVWGAGPLGTANSLGRFSQTYSTAGWARGRYKFRAFTNVSDGFRTTNEVTFTVW